MPKLTDFDPRWINIGDRKGLGFLFRCTTGHCQFYNATLFKNPLDGGPPYKGDSWALLDELLKEVDLLPKDDNTQLYHLVRGCGNCRWQRTGDTFETMSLTPSINAYECGHFTLTNGAW